MRYAIIPSPVGNLLLIASGLRLRSVHFEPFTIPTNARHDEAGLQPIIRQFQEYFDGQRTDFDLELEMLGTPFQCQVWKALREIPFGQTVSYGQIAQKLGRPTASRAVGMANGRNPLAIVVPCHRVIGTNGRLTGYAGGLERKQWLLEREKKV